MADDRPSAVPTAESLAGSRWLAPVVVAMLVLVVLLAAAPPQRVVLAPLGMVVLIAVAFIYGLRSGNTLPLDDIGIWFVPAVAIYAALPLLTFLLQGLQYSPFNDLRLYDQQPAPRDVGRIGWYHAAYLAAFVLIYAARRGRQSPVTITRIRVDRSTAIAATVLLVSCTAAVFALGLAYDLKAGSYSESYLVVQQLPVVARQLLRLALGMRVVGSLVVLAWIFAAYRRRRWLLTLWIAITGAQAVLSGGSRAPLILLLAGSAILYYRTVGRVALWKAGAGGAVLFALFMALGLARELRATTAPASFTLGLNAGEFESLFANAIDLEQRKQSGEFDILTPRLYLSEVVAAVPSQFVPFQKLDLSDWYLSTFYPEVKARGGGFAFGVVAQSIVGLGWLELVIRGAFVGFVFAWLHRVYQARADRLWPTVAYLWLVTHAYQSFRSGTLDPLAMFVQQFIPVLVVVEVGRRVVARAGASDRPAPRFVGSDG